MPVVIGMDPFESLVWNRGQGILLRPVVHLALPSLVGLACARYEGGSYPQFGPGLTSGSIPIYIDDRSFENNVKTAPIAVVHHAVASAADAWNEQAAGGYFSMAGFEW